MWAVVLAAVLGPADKCWLDEDVIPSLAASLARLGSLRCVWKRGWVRGPGVLAAQPCSSEPTWGRTAALLRLSAAEGFGLTSPAVYSCLVLLIM